MKGQEKLFSHNSDEWETPQNLFDELNREFRFTLDPCASDENHKCSKYYTKETNGLLQDWTGETVFINPPYSDIKSWIKKGFEEWCKDVTSVFLLPARTDTKWFHEFIYKKPYAEIRFIKGRLKFGDSTNSAPFPSMIVIFRSLK